MKRKNKPFNKKLTPSPLCDRRSAGRQFVVLLSLLLLLLAGGCARAPWMEPVDDERHRHLLARYDEHRHGAAQCGTAYDGDLNLSWRTSVDSVALAGYYQIQRPSSLRFNVTNPLGQPLVAVAVAAGGFQVLHVPRQTFYSGSLRSYALRHDIAPAVLSGPLFDWLTGRPIGGGVRVADIREDKSARGVWYAVVRDHKKGTVPIEHLLLDPASGLVVERIVVDEQDEQHARVSYDDWQQVGACRLPMVVTVTGISFWAEAELRFSEVQPARLSPSDFTLPVPSGYLRQFMP